MCRLKHSRFEWHCGHHDHPSIGAEQNTITSDIDLSIEQCRKAQEGKVQILDHSTNTRPHGPVQKKGQNSFNPTLMGRKAKKIETIVLEGLG